MLTERGSLESVRSSLVANFSLKAQLKHQQFIDGKAVIIRRYLSVCRGTKEILLQDDSVSRIAYYTDLVVAALMSQ